MPADTFAAPVDALHARFLIEQTIHRYSWLWDREAAAGIGSVFAEDAEGHLGEVTHGRAAIGELLERMRDDLHPPGTVAMHRNSNILFHELTPGRAHTTTYATYWAQLPGQRYEFHSGGVYDDILVPVGNTWLLQVRRWLWA